MLATCVFHQYTSAVWLSAQQYWISFKDIARYREHELHFLNKWLTDECTCFCFGGNSWDFDFAVVNKNEGLRVSEPHFYLRLTCVNSWFFKCFLILHKFMCFKELNLFIQCTHPAFSLFVHNYQLLSFL